jgi:hypothetical protein
VKIFNRQRKSREETLGNKKTTLSKFSPNSGLLKIVAGYSKQGYGSGSGSGIRIRIGSVFNRVCGSESVFGIRIRIRIQEGKNDPQK